MSTDLKNDLAGLRLEREPERTSRRWIAVLVLLVAIGAMGAGIWWLATREQPIQVDVASVTGSAGSFCGCSAL